ncbi:E3 ubiquitin-protein ligase znrf2 [Drosophila kikkawai]|uniref:E3 ubiquitin-protein ligase ZNRF1 n=1 Tax=Drosophila kikkawai TaxID=30033 RepID=A0A6P4IPV2_DROKI|nr:E3 ubiquitin-protein ligase znrf2 [Drosophila kikkawai]XP_017030535.1 E3 ubiquitin-protein ligase znrf2 [Drosophila kikkawai]
MGQKASTPATSGQQSPRSRTFSSSSTGAADQAPNAVGQNRSSNAVHASATGGDAGQGFNLLRTLPGLQVYHNNSNSSQNSTSIDRQRARSLSSVPDIQQQQQAAQQQQQGSLTSSGSSPHAVHSHGGHHPHAAVSVTVSANANNGGSTVGGSFPASATAGNNNGSATQTYMQQRRTLGDSIRDITMTGGNIAESIALAASATSANGIGRVYTATSLPSHIWSFNGIKCPVCNKFVLPDDIECHLVMCLTKPRLSYNEDVLSDAKGECVICLDDLSPGDTIARLPCLCIYHKGCIDRWFEVNRSCPEHPGD